MKAIQSGNALKVPRFQELIEGAVVENLDSYENKVMGKIHGIGWLPASRPVVRPEKKGAIPILTTL